MHDHNFRNAYISLFQKYSRCWPKNSLDMFLFVKCFMAGRAVAAIKIGLSTLPPPLYPQLTRKTPLRCTLPPLFQIFETFQDLVWKGCLTCVVQVTREAIVKCKLYYSLPLPILCYKSIIYRVFTEMLVNPTMQISEIAGECYGTLVNFCMVIKFSCFL